MSDYIDTTTYPEQGVSFVQASLVESGHTTDNFHNYECEWNCDTYNPVIRTHHELVEGYYWLSDQFHQRVAEVYIPSDHIRDLEVTGYRLYTPTEFRAV